MIPLEHKERKWLSPYLNAPRLPAGDALTISHILPATVGVGLSAPELELEIGPGRGGFLVDRLANSPAACIVGLEIRLKWASLVDQRVHELGLEGRGRVFAEDIRHALPRFASASVARVFIHFPDPWWKKKHAKRRLASGGVATELARLLRPGGELFVQTDVTDTAEAYRMAIESESAFAPYGDQPQSALLSENPYGARSPRERRVIASGLPVTRLRYLRSDASR
jgi:tRNA (guanine-N7-)-methyltransferase